MIKSESEAFQAQLKQDRVACEAGLEVLMSNKRVSADRLYDAMKYGVLNGGKRLRAALVMGSARMAHDKSSQKRAIRVTMSIECLHAYSLIHDDLPAMDDADTRRGKLSCHKAFDEATAILAGDSLQTLAFQILADPKTHSDPLIRTQLVSELAKAAGVNGMAGGQMLDLEAESGQFDFHQTKKMQMMKTGALISCAVISGGILGGADERLLEAQRKYARNLGVAFQIVDDLLDYSSDENILGKPAGADAQRRKAGFVVLFGYDKAKSEAERLILEANDSLAPWNHKAAYLQQLALFALNRKT